MTKQINGWRITANNLNGQKDVFFRKTQKEAVELKEKLESQHMQVRVEEWSISAESIMPVKPFQISGLISIIIGSILWFCNQLTGIPIIISTVFFIFAVFALTISCVNSTENREKIWKLILMQESKYNEKIKQEDVVFCKTLEEAVELKEKMENQEIQIRVEELSISAENIMPVKPFQISVWNKIRIGSLLWSCYTLAGISGIICIEIFIFVFIADMTSVINSTYNRKAIWKLIQLQEEEKIAEKIPKMSSYTEEYFQM